MISVPRHVAEQLHHLAWTPFIAGFLWIGVGLLAYFLIPIVRDIINTLLGFIIQAVLFVVRALIDAVLFVVNLLVQTVKDLVEFVGQWISAIIQYFQGDIIKAIFRIVLMAAFMWIFSLARQIPAIAQIMDTISETIASVVKFVNNLFDQARTAIEFLRKQLDAQVGQFADQLGEFGKLIRGDLLREVDTLFGGLETKIQSLRFHLLGKVDLLTAALNATVTIAGVRFRLLPDEARRYILGFVVRSGDQHYGELHALFIAAGPAAAGGTADAMAPWTLLEETSQDLANVLSGQKVPQAEAVQQALDDMLAVDAGEIPVLGDFPPTKDFQGPPPPPPPEPPPPPDLPLPLPQETVPTG